MATPVTPTDSTAFRAGLASFLVHAAIMFLFIGGGLYYPKLISFHESTAQKLPPMGLTLTEIPPPPPPPVLPAPAPAPSSTLLAPLGSTITAVPTPAPKTVPKTKQALHKRDGLAQHRTHKPPAAIPTTPFIPIAKAVPPKTAPKALPLLPPKPVIEAAPNKIPPHNLPIAPTIMAHPGKPQAQREALSPKPVTPRIPTLPSMPPPRAVPVEIPPLVVPTLPAMAPPRAQAVAIPAPVAVPAPVQEVALQPNPSPTPLPAPAPPPEAIEPPPPLASPEFALVPGPDRTKFPHPPYPYTARNQGLTGTVIMNVRFDARGGVISADVNQSSGVPILDVTTKSFILSHWHLPDYAGQTVSVPIIYVLDRAPIPRDM